MIIRKCGNVSVWEAQRLSKVVAMLQWKFSTKKLGCTPACTLPETNIFPEKAILKMMFRTSKGGSYVIVPWGVNRLSLEAH